MLFCQCYNFSLYIQQAVISSAIVVLAPPPPPGSATVVILFPVCIVGSTLVRPRGLYFRPGSGAGARTRALGP